MNQLMRCIAMVLVFIIVPHLASAEIYGWIDKNGVKHFSNVPPPDGSRIFTQQPEVPAGKTVERKQPAAAEPEATAPVVENSTKEVPGSKTETDEKTSGTQNLVPPDTQADDDGVAYPARIDRRMRRDRRIEIERRTEGTVTGPVIEHSPGREERGVKP